MRHDQYFISRRLKANKERTLDTDHEFFYEMAVDMEFPQAEDKEWKEEKDGESG